ncbi:type II and III secretion system protein family protein [Brevundimonas sp. UBA2416]|uniref:type II and III secretion system protein family protein n=1 Tax=Brevundimonas sp. UBA2416 TaxID=1946124 RepID=UPI0025C0D4CB|nr:type II and III secretion system protein family protein [Brevundimonas sp. UBA2416]
MKHLIAIALVGLTVAAVAPAGPTEAQAQSRAAVPMGAGAQLINLPRGSSMAIDLPSDARDVIVPNPMVAEAMLHSPRRITIIGLQPGETDAVVLDTAGRTILSLRIRVDAGVSALQDTLGRVMPGSQVRAEAVNDSIILTGPVSSPGEADRAAQVARAFVSAPEKVINMMTIAGSDQVMVRARVIEVQRTAIKQLGLDVNGVLSSVGDGLTFAQGATFGVSGSQLGGGVLNYLDQAGDGSRLSTNIRAFERAGLVRILAEPNVTAVNGENAEFLAGGEFPVPNGRSVDATTGQVTIGIEFKPYGVRLGFRPIVLSEGRISLQLSTEVSELTTAGAYTLGGTADDALVIPALNVRRASTTVELPSGGSMMIAGLLREDTRQNIDQLPGIGNLPVLGALFRSRDYLSGETELVIILEAYIVSPTSPGRLQTPADGLVIASDAQTLLFGQLNQQFRRPGDPAAPDSGWSGPVGYVIE